MAVDPGTGTVYLETNDDRGRGVLWLAGGTGCATATGSCAHLHPVMTLGSFDLDHPVPKVGFVIDEATHTLFAGVPSDRAVALLDTARCRATSTVCPPPTMVGVDRVPGTLGLDPTDDRVFVAGADSPGVLVLDGRRCHAAAASGCASASSVIQVRDATGHQVTAAAFAVDVRHGTLFVADGQAGTVVATSLP